MVSASHHMAEIAIILPRDSRKWRQVYISTLFRCYPHIFNDMRYLCQTHLYLTCAPVTLSVCRQEDRRVAAGLLSSANQRHLPVLPDHYMGGAKADGEKAASQP